MKRPLTTYYFTCLFLLVACLAGCRQSTMDSSLTDTGVSRELAVFR
ncbi:MAG: hypothetical protein LUD02_03690 [Tannerellaceae bacterium]|nr:hypothetical protein [Tannerellaceae bacterium]MCD8263361.1 hypothetical protein [Tannerellaceae bacterium]